MPAPVTNKQQHPTPTAPRGSELCVLSCRLGVHSIWNWKPSVRVFPLAMMDPGPQKRALKPPLTLVTHTGRPHTLQCA
jgi:hypothetical protein